MKDINYAVDYQMSSIAGTWSANDSYVTTRVISGDTRYKTYFSVPFEYISEEQMLARFKFYADSNSNGTYDGSDSYLGTVIVKSYGTDSGASGTFTSPAGSNIFYSYIGNTPVGEATFEGGTSWGNILSSGNAGSITPQTLATTASVDNLTGIKKVKDIFKFEADPSGQIDTVTGFRTKDKDILSISKAAFDIDGGTFGIAKNAKALTKQLGTNVDVVYYRKTGELILNTNGSEPGFGEDGGVFAVLAGRPALNLGSVEFF